MPTFAVELADKKTGKTHTERVTARDAKEAGEKASGEVFFVGSVTNLDENASDVPSNGNDLVLRAILEELKTIRSSRLISSPRGTIAESYFVLLAMTAALALILGVVIGVLRGMFKI